MKHLLYIFAVAITFMLFVPNTIGEDSRCQENIKASPYGSEEGWFDNMWEKATNQVDVQSDWNRNFSFGGSFGYPGKNLYIETYVKGQNAIFDEVLKYTADQTGFSVVEVRQILQGAITPISRRRQSIATAEAIKIAENVKKIFNDEKNILVFRQEILDDIQPSELFSNGNISDSGFDLIVDLETIELIIFGAQGEDDTGSGGGGDGGSSGGEGEKDKQKEETGEEKDAEQNKEDLENTETDKDKEDQKETPQTKETTPVGKESETGEGLEPNSCLTNIPLEEAITEFEDDQEEITEPEPPTEGNENPPEEKNDDDKKSEEPPTEGENEDNESDNTEETAPPPKIPASKPSKWEIPDLCGEMFCIEIGFVTDKKSTHADTDNCIACHIEKIRDTLKKVNSYSLTPKKVTGNLMEAPVCKKFVLPGEISIGFYVLTNPIATPQNDTAIFKRGSFAYNWNKFFAGKGLAPNDLFKFSPDAKPDNKTSSITEEVTKKIAGEAIEDESLATINAEIQNVIATETAKVEQSLQELKQATKGANQAFGFRAVEDEINQMITFFKSYKETFEGINSEICPKWESMKDCS